MPTPNDDQLIWDDDEDAKPAKRPAAKSRFRLKNHDVAAELADNREEGGNLVWILGGAGAGLAVLALIAALLPWGSGEQPEVAAQQPPVVQQPVAPQPPPQPEPRPQPQPEPLPEPLKPAVVPDPPVDRSLANSPKPALKKPPALDDPIELGRRAAVKPGRSLPVGAGVTKMAYSAKHDLLFAITASELTVHDAAGNNKIASFPATHAFTDLTVAPGGEAAYATDSPAEAVDGKPARVHRYDAARRAHQSLPAEGLAARVTALDESQLAVGGEKGGLTAYFWPTQANRGLVYLSPLHPAEGPLLFDPHRQRLHARAKWTDRNGEPATGVGTRENGPQGFQPEKRHQLDRSGGDLGSSFAMTCDGDLLFMGRVAVRTADQHALPFAFREEILAATRDVAVSVRGGCYHATSGTALGGLPFVPALAAPAADGKRLWLYNPLTAQAAEFELALAPPEVVLPPALTARTGLLARATDPAPAGSLVRAPEAAAKPFDQPVRRIAAAGRFGLVFLLTDKKLWVYSTADDKFTAVVTAAGDAELMDVALTPDEAFAFVTESEGAIGEPTPKPRGVQRVHRYGCADRRAESRDAPCTAHHILPASADTVLLRGPANLAEVTLARWTDGPGRMRALGDDGTPLAFRHRDPSVYGFDPYTGRYIATAPMGFVSEWKVGGDGLVPAANARVRVTGARSDKQVTVSSDGAFVYFGASQLPAAAPLAGEGKVFPKAVAVAARDVAVAGDGTLFAAATGKECGHLGYTPEAVAVARDGRTLWGYDAAKKRLVRHAIGSEGVAVAPPERPRDPVAFTAPPNPFPPGAPLTATAGKTASLGTARTSAHWVGYAPAGNYAFAQSADKLYVFDATTGAAKTVDGSPPFAFVNALAPDQSALFSSAGPVSRLDIGNGSWKSFPLVNRNFRPIDHLVPLAGDTYAVFESAFGDTTGRLAVYRWDGTRLQPLGSEELSAGGLMYLGYDPASGNLLAAWPEKTQVVFQRAWLDGGKLRLGGQIRIDTDDRVVGKLVMSVTGKYGYVGSHRLTPQDGKQEKVNYGGKVLAAVHDWVLTDKGELRDSATGKARGELGLKPAAAAFAPDGKSAWVADEKGGLVRFELTAKAGVIAPPVALKSFADWTPPAVPRPELPAARLTKFEEVGTVPDLLGEATSVIASDKYNLVVLWKSFVELVVVDAATGKRIPGPKDLRPVSAVLSPDQEALFASDLEGKLFRFTLKDRAWDSAKGDPVVYAAVDARTILTGKLVPGGPKGDPIRLMSWTGGELVELAAATAPGPLPKTAYDPVAARLYISWTDQRLAEAQLSAFPVGKKAFAEAWRVPVKGVNARHGVVCLASDGSRFYAHGESFDTATGKVAAKFPEEIVAATRDAAVGLTGNLYDPTTGRKIGSVPHAVEAGGVTPDGVTVWLLDRGKKLVRKYQPTSAGGVVVAPPVKPPVIPPVNPPVNPPKGPPLVADDWSPTAIERPKLAAAPGTQTVLTRAATGTTTLKKVSELAHSDKHDRLVIAERNGSVAVFDGKTLKEVSAGDGGPTKAVEMSLAPDQSAVFVSERNKLHRLDLATLKWAARDNPFGSRIVAIGDDRLLASDGPTKAELTLMKWGTDRLVPTARAELPGPADLLRYDPATATAFVIGREPPLPYFTRVTVDKGKLTVAEKKRLMALFNGGRIVGRLPLSWDGSWILGEKGVNTADGTVSAIPGALPDDVLGASRDLIYCRQSVLSNGKPLRVATYPFSSHVAVSPAGNAVFMVDESVGKLFRFTLSASAPVAVVPKGNIEDFKPTLFPRPQPPAAPLTKFTEKSARDVAGPTDYTAVLYSDRHAAVIATTKGGVTIQEAATGKSFPGAAPPNGDHLRLAALAPDQSALFALGSDGLHRYDFAAKKWESRPVRGGRAIPLDGSTVLLTALTGTTGPAEVVRWTADGVSVLGTARLQANSTYAYDAATGSLYVGVRGAPGTKSQLRKYPLGGKPFAAEWATDLPGAATTTPIVVLAADGKRVFAGKDAFDAATGKPAGDPFPEAIRFATHGFLLSATGKLYHPDTGKELAALPHATIPGAVAADGKSAVFLDRGGAKLRRYDITAGGIAPPPKDPPKIPPKAEAWPALPYAPGTQTVLKEVDRIPNGPAGVMAILASEPLGVLVVSSTPKDGTFRLYDLKTRKPLAIRSPVVVVHDLLTPPDRSALYIAGAKQLHRLNADRTGWESIDLPAGTRRVMPVAKDRFVVSTNAMVREGVFATAHQEMTWADGKLTAGRELKPQPPLISYWMSPTGQLQGYRPTDPAKPTEFKLAELALTDAGLEETWSHPVKSKLRTLMDFRSSWGGNRLFMPELLVDRTNEPPTERKPPEKLVAGSRDLLFGYSGEYYTADLKSAGKFPHRIEAADVTLDGKALWVCDPDKKELVKYALTDGK